jgi:stearoyl-CoA desaturase (delta-9 desaturase)
MIFWGRTVTSTERNMTQALARPSTVDPRRVMWMYLVVIGGFHLLLPLAFLPQYFSWWYVLLLLPGNYVFGSLGINLAYHRILTHRSLETPRWLERLVTLFGVCSLQGSPLRWVTIHRIHHQFSDEQEDPHSPLVTFLWGHMSWLFLVNTQLERLSTYERYAPDLLEDPFQRWLHRRYTWLYVYFAHAALLGALVVGVGFLVAPTAAEALTLAGGLFLWGVVVRTVYVWHITWFVNSLSHYAGYQNYDTKDGSRNNWFVALLTNGEGWHNNHHAAPRAAAHGHRWWEIDLTYWTIVVMQRLGLAWKVVPVKVPKAMLKAGEGEAPAEPTMPGSLALPERGPEPAREAS